MCVDASAIEVLCQELTTADAARYVITPMEQGVAAVGNRLTCMHMQCRSGQISQVSVEQTCLDEFA